MALIYGGVRPSSFSSNYATKVGCGNAFDSPSSVIPNTTTCCSFTCNSTGTDKIGLRNFPAAGFTPDSRWDLKVAIGCRSMGTMYLTPQYSVNGGGAWTSIVASYGSTAARSIDVFTASIAKTQDPRSLWFRLGATTTHSRGRAKLFDVCLVGSYSTPDQRIISERGYGRQVGMDDFTRANCWGFLCDSQPDGVLSKWSPLSIGQWTTGELQYQDGVCKTTSYADCAAVWKESSAFTDQRVSATLVRSSNETAHIILRADGAISANGNAYQFVIADEYIELLRQVGGSGFTSLTGTSFTGSWGGNRFTCQVASRTLSAWIDNAGVPLLVCSYNDTTSTLSRGGGAGLRLEGLGVSWDDFTIERLNTGIGVGVADWMVYTKPPAPPIFRTPYNPAGVTDALNFRKYVAYAREARDTEGITDVSGRQMTYRRIPE